jgi:hypothetical protein
VSRNDSAQRGMTGSASIDAASAKAHAVIDALSPLMAQAKNQASGGYTRVREVYLPRVSDTVGRSARQLADASRPVREQAVGRGAAALAGLRGTITPEDIERATRRRDRHTGRNLLLVGGVVSLVSGVTVLVWRRRRTTTSWITEDPDASRAEYVPSADELSAEAKSRAAALSQRVGDAAKGAADKVRDVAHRASDKVNKGARAVGDKSAEAASAVDDAVSDAKDAAEDKANAVASELSADARGNWP